jgi:hypothetical protein
MRTVLLISFFACLFLHFQSQKKVVSITEEDVLSIKQSAVKKAPLHKPQLPTAKIEVTDKEALSAFSSKETSFVAETEYEDEEEEDEEYDGEDLSQLPWSDIEDGWKNNLKEYLVSVDPDKADEMFSAYMDEKKKFAERVDFSDANTTVADDAASSTDEAVVEGDSKEDELQRTHAENLKEIFGDHYSQVESLHKEYVESVQYLNRSSVKFSISL